MWLDLREHFAARAIEWFNSFYLTAWGAYLILHPGLFTGPLQPAWQGLYVIAPQEYWGFGAFVAGSSRTVALFINGKWGLTPLIRVATSFLSVGVWFCVAVGFVRSGIPNTGIIIFGGLMLSDMYSAFRAAGDAYEAGAMKRLEQLSRSSANVASLRAK
jgi:hypothetical protein